MMRATRDVRADLWMVLMVLVVPSGCIGTTDERTAPAIDVGEPTMSESCAEAAAAVAAGSREADVAGEHTLDRVSEWSDALAVWDSLQDPADVDEFLLPITDSMTAALEPWVRIEMSDTVGHAWLELCAYYEGPGDSACFVGSEPATRPSADGQTPGLPGCCKTTDEYGGADVHLDVGSAWGDDSGALHITVRSPDATCAGYWLMATGSRRY